jgi:hypothetical protein
MRKRIFNQWSLGMVMNQLRDFTLLGDANFAWNGPQVYDYSFASLALVKRP